MRFLSVCSGIEAVSVATVKRCGRCGATKSLEEFHRQPSGTLGRFSYCKPCANAYQRATKKRNYSAEQKRNWQYRARYGLSIDEVKAMLAAQGGLCAICGQPPARVCVDHDHLSGAVRSILCHGCNIKLPAVEDAEFRLRALAYLGGAS